MVLGALVIIVVGVLVVNYFKDRSTVGQVPSVSTNNQENQTETVPGKTYTVVKGDNLWKIAEAAYGSGYNWVDIAKENNLANPSAIDAGQVLTLPQVEAKQPTVNSALAANKGGVVNSSSAAGPSISGATYEVVKGDNLWNISVRAYGDGYKWTQIASENKLVHPNVIHPGNILILPR